MFECSFVICILLFHCYYAIPIDNNIKGYPQVTCGIRSVRVDIDTEKSFEGRVYVKGESDKKGCLKSFATTSTASLEKLQYAAKEIVGESVGIELGFGQCNMRRQRTLSPRGVEYTFTLVVSFHSIFITKVDKAYRVRCFYMETEKTVAQQLDVSMLSTQAINEQFPMPVCRYHIRRGGRDGPSVRFAIVGEPVYHVWECDSAASAVYGMLVKSCFVDDGNGNKVELINEKGCANDKYLIPNLTYDTSRLDTFTESHVFKYADRASMFFACTLLICFKEDGGCNGITPPDCGALDPLYSQATHGNGSTFDKPPISRDVPFIPAESLLTNFTKVERESEFETNYNVTKQEFDSWVALWQHGVRSKHRGQKREINEKIKRSTLEADINAKPFVVLPFDEHNDENLLADELMLMNSKIINDDAATTESTVENSKMVSSTQSFNVAGGYVYRLKTHSTKTKGFCISSNWFGLGLTTIFFLLILSVSLTILFVSRQTKRTDVKPMFTE